MKSVLMIFGVLFIFAGLGAFMNGLEDFRGKDFTEPHSVTTGVSGDSTTIALANELLDDSTTYITVTSDNASDFPIPYTYVEETRQLTITGLHESDSRALTVVYLVPRLDAFTDFIAQFTPALLILTGLGLMGGSVYLVFAQRSDD